MQANHQAYDFAQPSTQQPRPQQHFPQLNPYNHPHANSQRQPSPSPQSDPDYVYFERSTDGFSKNTTDRAAAAKLKLEHFYKIAVEQAIERNSR